MNIELGHLVLSVRSLDVSVPFYCNVFGIRTRRRTKVGGKRMAFLTFGARDHDIAFVEVGASAPPHDENRSGLQHIAFRIGNRIEELRAFKKHLDALGIMPHRVREHRVSWSIYMRDPDGIELEAYVDSDTPILEADGELEVIHRPFHLD